MEKQTLMNTHAFPAKHTSRAFSKGGFSLVKSLCAAVFAIQTTAAVLCTAQTPLPPNIDGTYYYGGYASNRYTYISNTGTYYYVDSGGVTTVGGQASVPVSTPYRTVVAGGIANFQFYNAHPDLYTVTTATSGTIVTSSTGYAVRSGTWSINNTTFNVTHSDAAAIWAVGYTGTFSHPVTITGTNINAIVSNTVSASNQAVYLRNGASAYIYGGTLSKTVTGNNTNAAETIYIGGNQEGLGSSSHLYGENLTIIANGPNTTTLTMGDGNNTVTLKNSTITSITQKAYTADVIFLNDSKDLGGNHFYGENITINSNAGCVVRLGDGANTFTLVSSTLANTGTGTTIRWTSPSSGDRFESVLTLKNTLTSSTADYSPIFQMIGDRGRAIVTGGTLITTGTGSTILRLVAQNDNSDSTRFVATFQDTVLDARNASAIDINIDAGDSIHYGQAGGGTKDIVTKIEDSFDIIIQSSTVTGGVAAMRIAAAGAANQPYSDTTNLFIYDSTFSGGIQMVAGGLNFTSGADLTVTASNSRLSGGIFITGTEAARHSNQAIFHVYDSTWTGDITLTNRGNLTLHFNNTPITGTLSLSGSTQTQLRLTNSPIANGITISDKATLTGEIVGAGRVGPIAAQGGVMDITLDHSPTGRITGDGTGVMILRIDDDVDLTDGVQLSGSSTLDLTLRNTSRFTGDVNVLDRATLAITTGRNDPLTLSGNVALGGIWRITGKTTLDGNLAITHPLGTIAIAIARSDSLTLPHGLTGNGRLDIISIDSSAISSAEIRVIHDQTGTLRPNALILAHPVDYGLAAYTLQNRPDGAYLVGGLDSGSFGTGGAAVFNSQALAVEDWFAALAPLNHRLGQLRETNADILSGVLGGNTPASGDTGAFWFEGRADTTSVNLASDSLDFESRTLGMTAGADVRWDYATATLATGIFATTARTNRDFAGSADGHTTSVGGGLYVHYHHRTGLYASAIARYDIYETALDAHNPDNAISANYNSQAGGLILEAGWHANLRADWWFECAYQASFASLPGISYTTQSNKQGNKISISTADTNANQQLLRVALGKTVGKNWSLRGYLAGANVDANGGAFTAPGLNRADFTLVGSRVEFALGVTYIFTRASRLSLNVTNIVADHYERPYSVTLGYSHSW